MAILSHEQGFMETFKAVFGRPCPYNFGEAVKIFGAGIQVPRAVKPSGALAKEIVYAAKPVPRMVNLKDIEAKYGDVKIMEPKSEPIKDIDDIKRLVDYLYFFAGNKYLNSQDSEKSDGFYESTHVYASSYIYKSKYVGFSDHLTECEYAYGSHDVHRSNLCIRCQDSESLSNCYETSWSAKSSNLMFCHAVVNMRDSLFCFHIASGQYKVANRQYSKEEYMKIKKMVVDYLFENDFKLDFYPVL